MRHRFALGVVAFTLGAACVSAGSQAQQDSGIPCDAFIRNDDGSWTAARSVTFPGPGRNFNIRDGATFRPGAAFLGVDVAEQLTQQCPATSATAPTPEPGQVPAQGPAPAILPASPAPFVLSKYADANGDIDARKLTCAQLADATQEESDFLGFWFSGWYNGLAKKHAINVRRVREGFRDVIVHCKANKDQRIIQAIDVVRKQGRR